MNEYYQHGDVLLKKTDETMPQGLVECDHNRVQEGEATGHFHGLYGGIWSILMNPKTKQREFLKVVETTSLKHQEHKEQSIPPGVYRIQIVREYNHFEEEAKQVED